MDHYPLILIGAGGHAKVVLDAACGLGLTVKGVYDDDPSADACSTGSVVWLGEIEQRCDDPAVRYFVAVGDIEARKRCIARIEPACVCEPVVHGSAVVSSSAVLDAGVFVSAGAIINADARIGGHAIINTGAIVEHDCVVGTNTHIAPRVTLGGAAVVGNHTLVGIGSTVLPGVHIGDGCTIGSGAVVIGDVEDGATVVGNPARVVGARVSGV